MRINGCTLSLMLPVLLDSIELISSTTSLDVLFPGYNGVLPYIEEYHGFILNFQNFKSYNGIKNQVNRRMVFLSRNDVIVGAEWHDNIVPPFFARGHENKFIVFNISDRASDSQWVELAEADFIKLGALRNLELVQARDYIVRRTVENSRYQGDLRAQKEACLHANAAADETERMLLGRAKKRHQMIEEIIPSVEMDFDIVYNRVYKSVMDRNQPSNSGSATS